MTGTRRPFGQPGRARGPLAGLADLADFLADEERASTFLRGLTIGALVGAAIAGSRIWARRKSRGRSKEAASQTGPD